MLKIRLARVGKKGHATFRIVVTEHTRPPKSGSLAQLGWYDPHQNRLQVDAEKVSWYLARGARASPTVRNLLITHEVIKGPKVVTWKPKRKNREGVVRSVNAAEPKTTESRPAEETSTELGATEKVALTPTPTVVQ